MSEKCKKCGSKLALTKIYCTSVWHDEPYEDGKEECVILENGTISDNPDIEINVTMLICPDCHNAAWLSIEECNYEIREVSNHTKKGELDREK